MTEEEKDLRIKFALYPGLGPRTLHKISEEYPGLVELRNAFLRGKVKNLNNEKLISFLREVDEIDTRSLLDELDSLGTKFLVLGEDNYPERLSYIYDPPILLFYKGNIELLKRQSRLISVVGTRGYSDYGKFVTQKFVKLLAKYDFVIVSGMAYGIDAIAHKAALENNAHTVAVLASSADKPTPAGNGKLYNEILANDGLVLSETLPGVEVNDRFFPKRNRIIAGLSENLLITEAGIKSGAMVTAREALDSGANVFVVPNAISHKNLQGTNYLAYKDNAKPVFDENIFLFDLDVFKWEQKFKRQLPRLTELQEKIVESIKKQPKTLDEIQKEFDNNNSILLASLTEMELKEVLEQDELGRYFYLY